VTQDKLAHLFAGGFIAAALLPFGWIPALACVALAAVGIGKELVDPRIGGNRDVVDAVATALGGLFIVAVSGNVT